MRNIIKLLGLILASMAVLEAQNPYWVFPPNYVDFKTDQVLTLPAATSYTKGSDDLSNGFFTQAGVSKFNLGKEYNSFTTTSYSNSTTSTSSVQNNYRSTECILLPSIKNCDVYYSLATDLIISGSRFLKPISISISSSTYGYNGLYDLATAPVQFETGTHIALAASNPKVVSSKVVFDLYSLTSTSGVYYLHKTRYDDTPALQGTTTLTSVSIGAQLSIPSELELSRDERYLAWGDMSSGTLFIYDLINTSLSTINVSDATRITGVEFSKDSRYLYFSKASASTPGIGVYDVIGATMLSDVPSTSDLNTTHLELAIDGRVYGSNGTQLKGFDSGNPSSGITKTYTIGNPFLTYYGVYTLVDQVDNLDYENAFTYFACKPVEYLSGTLSGTQTYSASLYVVNTGNTTVSNSANINITAGSYISFVPGFSTSYSTTGYLSASIQDCSSQSPSSCTSYRKEDMESGTSSVVQTDLTIYPNPISSGLLNFNRRVTNFRIINSTGTEVLTGSNVNHVNVDGLAKGLYLLYLDDHMHKMVIQ